MQDLYSSLKLFGKFSCNTFLLFNLEMGFPEALLKKEGQELENLKKGGGGRGGCPSKKMM